MAWLRESFACGSESATRASSLGPKTKLPSAKTSVPGTSSLRVRSYSPSRLGSLAFLGATISHCEPQMALGLLPRRYSKELRQKPGSQWQVPLRASILCRYLHPSRPSGFHSRLLAGPASIGGQISADARGTSEVSCAFMRPIALQSRSHSDSYNARGVRLVQQA